MEKRYKPDLEINQTAIKPDFILPENQILSARELIRLSEPQGTIRHITPQQEKEIIIAYNQMIDRALRGEPITVHGEPREKVSFRFYNPEGASRWAIVVLMWSASIGIGAKFIGWGLGEIGFGISMISISSSTITGILLIIAAISFVIILIKLPRRRSVTTYSDDNDLTGSGRGGKKGGDVNINIGIKVDQH